MNLCLEDMKILINFLSAFKIDINDIKVESFLLRNEVFGIFFLHILEIVNI